MSVISPDGSPVPNIDVATDTLTDGLIRDAFKELLEKRHLYQYVKITWESLDKLVQSYQAYEVRAYGERKAAKLKTSDWAPRTRDGTTAEQYLRGLPQEDQRIGFQLPNVTLFCKICGSREAFRPFDFADFEIERAFELHPKNAAASNPIRNSEHHTQIFLLAYQCQRCQSTPECFTVSRLGEKITLVGRSPIEEIQVDDCFPQAQRKYISDATLAYQCGQTLSGLFQLRVFIEQFARSIVPEGDLPADQLLEKYNGTLPSDFKDRFPSIKELYGRLSDSIHDARADQELFKDVLEKLTEHFEARRLFKLDVRGN